MDQVNFILTMAGKGSRFRGSNYTRPKAFIEMPDGRPMFSWSLDGITGAHFARVFLVILEKDFAEFHQYVIAEMDKMQSRGVECIVVPLPETPHGQALSALEAVKFIDNGSILIYGADTREDTSNFISQVAKLNNCTGAVATFQPNPDDDHFSFAKLDDQTRVLEVAEKKKISNHALSGLYYFRSRYVFQSAVYHSLELQDETELYVAPLYNFVRNAFPPGEVFGIPSKDYEVYGTPTELGELEQRF